MNEPTITITGNLTADPELRYTANGTPVANFTVASTPQTKTATGDWEDGETMYVRCTTWQYYAENITETLRKGSRVIVTGRLTVRSYQRTDGTTGTSLDLAADEIGACLRYATAQITPAKGAYTNKQDARGTRTPFNTQRGSNRRTGNHSANTATTPTQQPPF